MKRKNPSKSKTVFEINNNLIFKKRKFEYLLMS